MLLETAFENGQEVFYLKKAKVLNNKIHSTQIIIEADGRIKVDYFIKYKHTENQIDYSFEMINENECFISRESLIAQL